ncbi:MAG: AI-2E family transporter, partial [Acidimicrobiales bacterium]|nr:AI-2E family transporter [Acidimicrobiales bacterium]
MAGTDRGTDPTTVALPAADVTVQLSARSLVAIGGAVLVAIAVVGLVGPTRDTLVRIAIGLVLALALDPLVCALQRRGLTRRRAAAAIGLAAVAVGGLVIVLVGPATIDQANRFEEELPQMAEGFYDLPLVGGTLRERDAAGRLEDLVADLPARVDDRTVSDTAESLLGGALTALIVLAVAFGVMLDG